MLHEDRYVYAVYARPLCMCPHIWERRVGLEVCVLQQSCNRAATELQQTGSVSA